MTIDQGLYRNLEALTLVLRLLQSATPKGRLGIDFFTEFHLDLRASEHSEVKRKIILSS